VSRPTVVAIDGRPYRFRPVPEWRAPSLAWAPPLPPAAVYALPGWTPPPVLVAHGSWPAAPVPPPAFRPVATPWAQPLPLVVPGPDGRIAYRFRPDARFPASVAFSRVTTPWVGQASGADQHAGLGDDGRYPREPPLDTAASRGNRVAFLNN
jgi:hypothetical protein